MSQRTNLAPFNGELYWLPSFFPSVEADQLFQKFYDSLAWQQERLFIYGRWVNVPRLMAWYGDADAHYRYSGVDHQPIPWNPSLRSLCVHMEETCGQGFNSVLANLYRDGNDSMGCHADDEKELGSNPTIASLSLGETRLLRFKHRSTGDKLDLDLKHGDLLIMAGELQQHWLHEVPKTRKRKLPRINLTFRQILLSR